MSRFKFIDQVKGGAIPHTFIPAVEKGVREGIVTGTEPGTAFAGHQTAGGEGADASGELKGCHSRLNALSAGQALPDA